MNNDRKRKRAPSFNGDSTTAVLEKRQKTADAELDPPPPPPRPPDATGFFKRITSTAKQATTQASVHKGYHYSVGIAEPFQKLKQPWNAQARDNRVKTGHLSSADYEDGYISEEGDTFLKAIHAHKDSQIADVEHLEDGNTSRSGNRIRIGKVNTTPYHGVDIKYRVDFTEVEDKPAEAKKSRKKKGGHQGEGEAPTPPAKHWEPHARILAFDKNASTAELAEFASNVGKHADQTEQQHFLEGVKGQAPPTPQIPDAFASGVELRAVGRASDAFGHVFPSFEGLLMSKPQTPEDVRNLFFHPEFRTGALGHQNSGPGATADFNSFKEIVADKRVQHSTNKGTNIDTVSLVRKAKAINAIVPHDAPIVTITTRAKDL